MASKENDKKQSSGLKNFVKSLLDVSPAAVAKIGFKEGVKLRKKKPKPKKKKRTGNIEKERTVFGDKKARQSFLTQADKEIETQNPKPKK